MNIIDELIDEKEYATKMYAARLECIIKKLTRAIEANQGSRYLNDIIKQFDEKDQTLLTRLNYGGKL